MISCIPDKIYGINHSVMQIPSRQEIIRKLRNNNKKISLVFPIYYPSALLRAFDIHPVEILNAPDVDLSLADAHIQSYTCSLGRILLSFIKEERFQNQYDLIFIPHICDTFQQIGSLLVDFIRPSQPVINFYLPKRSDETGISFCIDELKRIAGILENVCGSKLDIKRLTLELGKDIEINNLLKEVFEKREFLPVSDTDFYRIITSKTYLPPDDFIKILKELLASKTDSKRKTGKRIFISGISAEPPEIFEIINSHNASVVFDDLAVSGRRIIDFSGFSDEPFRRQSEMMLYTMPDAEKGSPIEKRAYWIREKIKRTGATGGIFYIMKFCEPEFFDYPQLKKYLLSEGTKTFLIEYEMTGKVSKQNINRIQSFIEGL